MSIHALIREAQEMLQASESDDVMVQKQLELEETSDGFERELREGKRLKDIFTRPTDDPRMQSIICAVFDDMSKYLEEELQQTVRGSGAKYRTILRALDTEVLVGTILAHSLDSLLNKDSVANSIQRLGSSIGRGIVTEVKVDQAFKVNPYYMKKVEGNIIRKGTRNKKHIKAVYDKAFDVVTVGKLEYNLNEGDYIQIGKFGLEAMLRAGLIVKTEIFSNKKNWNIYNISDSILEYILEFAPDIHKRSTNATFKYMLVPPDPWEGLVGGGFKSVRRKMNNPLIVMKGFDKPTFEIYKEKFTPDKCPNVFKFANYIQSIPFTISTDVVQLLYDVLDVGGGMFGVPDGSPTPEPKFPFDELWVKDLATEQEQEEFTLWKHRKSQWHENELKRKQKQREMYSLFQAVRDGITKLYLPVFYDFRGRLYYNSNPSPQGSDIARACLNFYERKPLGKRGLYWLKVHLANCLGFDKDKFDLRVKFIDDQLEDLFKAVQSPLDLHGMFGSVNPVSAYITTLELFKAIQSGDPESYMCNIPVHMDATVSGTQHFSAMLRDPVGAEYTNLINLGLDSKADMYTRVADATLEDIQKDLGTEYTELAEFWIKLGVPRDLAKRPVMTYTYGVTIFTVTDHINGFMQEHNIRSVKDGSKYLAQSLFKGIAKTIPATVKGMDFLRAVAREVGEKPMQWATPAGFPIYFNAKGQDTKRIAVRSAGVDLVQLRVTGKETVQGKMVSGISPNYVHGNDASHLCLTGCSMADSGLQMVSIHDSIGTHPCDVDALHIKVREEFVKMYSKDVLKEFAEQVGTKVELPEYGSFDINAVLDSEFFFC